MRETAQKSTINDKCQVCCTLRERLTQLIASYHCACQLVQLWNEKIFILNFYCPKRAHHASRDLWSLTNSREKGLDHPLVD